MTQNCYEIMIIFILLWQKTFSYVYMNIKLSWQCALLKLMYYSGFAQVE